MAVFCNEFVDIDKHCKNVESFVKDNFNSFIKNGRKWRPAERTLSFIFTNVLLETHQKQDSGNYLNFTYSRDNNQKACSYAGYKIGVKSMKKALEFLESEGWTTHRKGYNARKNNPSTPLSVRKQLSVRCMTSLAPLARLSMRTLPAVP